MHYLHATCLSFARSRLILYLVTLQGPYANPRDLTEVRASLKVLVTVFIFYRYISAMVETGHHAHGYLNNHPNLSQC